LFVWLAAPQPPARLRLLEWQSSPWNVGSARCSASCTGHRLCFHAAAPLSLDSILLYSCCSFGQFVSA
jgi:hypothetical protein